MFGFVLSLLLFAQICCASDLDVTLSDEPVHILAQRVIDYLEDSDKILEAFDEITEVHQDLSLHGLLCHHYAITKTLGLRAVPRALKEEYETEYLESILKNCYRELNGAKPTRAGDLIVYFDSGENITHFGIYRGNGMVESKWGSEECILLHPLLFVPSGYGTSIASYRPKFGVRQKHLRALYKNMYEEPKNHTKKRKMDSTEEGDHNPGEFKKGKKPVRVETAAERLIRVMKPTPQHRRVK